MEAKPDRIHGIVRNGEALDRDVADHPARTRLELLYRRSELWATGLFIPIDHGRCQRGDENRQAAFSSSLASEPAASKAGDVVGMFVRDQNGVEIFRLFADLAPAGAPVRAR